MIYPFAFTCPRDWDLFEYLTQSVKALGNPNVAPFVAFHDKAEPPTAKMAAFMESNGIISSVRRDGFFPWEGKVSCFSKVDGYERMMALRNPGESDYLASVDCDSIFFTSAIFGVLGDADFYGFPHSQKFYVEELDADWSWMSGALQIARVGKARRVVEMMHHDSLEPVFSILSRIGQAHNEDVAFSLAMALVGASARSLNGYEELFPELAIRGEGPSAKGAFAHLAGGWRSFLGLPIAGKWDIPRAIREWQRS